MPVTDYTYDDCRLMSKARSKNLPCETGLVEVTKLMHQLGLNMAAIEAEMDSFADIARKRDGLIRLTEFAAYLGIPSSEPGLVELFNLYDRVSRVGGGRVLNDGVFRLNTVCFDVREFGRGVC